MLTYQAYTVYDAKAEAWTAPTFKINDAVAIREFSTMVNDPGSAYNLYPEDYTLFRVGSFDVLHGDLAGETGTALIKGIECHQQQENPDYSGPRSNA